MKIATYPKINRSELFLTAWDYLRDKTFATFGECLSAAWSALRLKALLKLGRVAITFVKSKGEETTRIGTLNSDLFTYESKGSGRRSATGQIAFYSLTNEAFRSLRIERLISFEALAEETKTAERETGAIIVKLAA